MTLPMIHLLPSQLNFSIPKCLSGTGLRQFVEQCLSLLEIGGVKPLGEPAVDRCQELVGFGTLTLLLPQTDQAHGGSQLPGFGLLAAGNGEGLLEAGFGLGRIWSRLA